MKRRPTSSDSHLDSLGSSRARRDRCRGSSDAGGPRSSRRAMGVRHGGTKAVTTEGNEARRVVRGIELEAPGHAAPPREHQRQRGGLAT